VVWNPVIEAYNIIYKTKIQPMKIARVLIAMISLGLAVSAGRTIVELWEQKGRVGEKERELTRVLTENKRLESQLTDMKNPSYVERVARDQLGMVKEGETMVMLPQGGANAEGRGNSGELPVWQQWFRLFF
jgi:cell division protein DivIC